jgi:thiol-disulfide isomerase/thioredoxin
VTRTVAILAALLVLAAGCARAGGHPPVVRASPSGPPCLSPVTGPPSPGPAAGDPLPELALPCLDGGRPVDLARLGTPTVVNLWASWCGPCRQELPAFQRYADRAGDRLRVIGVITRDRDAAARSMMTDLGLRFPMLVDDEGALLAGVGRQALPVTLFVDARGRIAYLYNAQALDEPTLELLAEQHLGVVVPR